MKTEKKHKGPPPIPKFIDRPEPLPPEIERLPPAALAAAINWDVWTPPLLLFAAWCIGRRPWRGQYLDESMRRQMAHDFMTEVMKAWLGGRRRFNSEKIHFFEWYCGAIASLVDRAAKRRENRTPHDALVGGDQVEIPGTIFEAEIIELRSSQEDALLAKEYVALLERDATPDELAYIDVLRKLEKVQEAEAAAILDWTVEKVRAVRKTIKYRLRLILAGAPLPPRRPRRK